MYKKFWKFLFLLPKWWENHIYVIDEKRLNKINFESNWAQEKCWRVRMDIIWDFWTDQIRFYGRFSSQVVMVTWKFFFKLSGMMASPRNRKWSKSSIQPSQTNLINMYLTVLTLIFIIFFVFVSIFQIWFVTIFSMKKFHIFHIYIAFISENIHFWNLRPIRTWSAGSN